MFDRACLVGLKSEKVASCTNSASALLLDCRHGYVLTHASLLLPLVDEDTHLGKQILGGIHAGVSTFGPKAFGAVSVQVKLAKHEFQKDKIEVPAKDDISPRKRLAKSHSVSLSVVNTNVLDTRSTDYPGHICCVFKCPNFSEALHPLLKDTNVSPRKTKGERDDASAWDVHVLSSLMPYFVLVQLKPWRAYSDPLSLRSARACHIGERIQLCGTPFGDLTPGVFFNSVSEGVISGITGRTKSLLVTDARSVPGSEGGPAFTFLGTEKILTGVVASSMCWSGNEWVGFCLVCSVDEIIGNLPANFTPRDLLDCDFDSSTAMAARSQMLDTQAAALKDCGSERKVKVEPSWIVSFQKVFPGIPPAVLSSVVCVNNGSMWGSGVIISRQDKLVLTCSHVVKGHQHGVTVRLQPGQPPRAARVLYHCNPVVPMDLALLSCSAVTSGEPLNLHTEAPKEGSRVFVVGFGIFKEELRSGPLVSAGVIAKVVRVNGVPVMIQTTGAVHSGCSGGALVSAEGKLVGIVVCNVKDMDSGTSFPHINLSIPIMAAWPVLQEYIARRDASCLKGLQVSNPLISKLWSLSQVSTASEERKPLLSKL